MTKPGFILVQKHETTRSTVTTIVKPQASQSILTGCPKSSPVPILKIALNREYHCASEAFAQEHDEKNNTQPSKTDRLIRGPNALPIRPRVSQTTSAQYPSFLRRRAYARNVSFLKFATVVYYLYQQPVESQLSVPLHDHQA